MHEELIISCLAELEEAARQFLSAIRDRRIIAFRAPMGAGKTTFISAICRVLGIREDAVGSPTFAIVNEYRTATGEPVYHFDFYRLEKTSEALDLGLYDYLDSGALCLIEWPDIVSDLLPEETLYVDIAVRPDGSRAISW